MAKRNPKPRPNPIVMCVYCQKEFSRNELFKHQWTEHRAQMQERVQKASQSAAEKRAKAKKEEALLDEGGNGNGGGASSSGSDDKLESFGPELKIDSGGQSRMPPPGDGKIEAPPEGDYGSGDEDGDEKPRKVKTEKTGTSTRVATNPSEASIFSIVPKKYEFNSVLAPQAKLICERELNWPEYSFGDWLDTFIYLSMKFYWGFILGAYQKIEPRQIPQEELVREEV